MRLVCGEQEIVLSAEPLTVTRATFTPTDLRVSREVCRASVVADRVQLVACRAGLRVKQTAEAEFAMLERAGDVVLLEEGGCVELCRGSGGGPGVLAHVRAVEAARADTASPPSVAVPAAMPAAEPRRGWIKVSKAKSGSSPSVSASPAADSAKETEAAEEHTSEYT